MDRWHASAGGESDVNSEPAEMYLVKYPPLVPPLHSDPHTHTPAMYSWHNEVHCTVCTGLHSLLREEVSPLVHLVGGSVYLGLLPAVGRLLLVRWCVCMLR